MLVYVYNTITQVTWCAGAARGAVALRVGAGRQRRGQHGGGGVHALRALLRRGGALPLLPRRLRAAAAAVRRHRAAA